MMSYERENRMPDCESSHTSAASLELVRQWCAGDEDAARRLHDRYADRLIRLVSSRLSRRFLSRFDAEDVVESALASIFVRTRDGRTLLADDGRLWPLLVQFTLHKLQNRIRANLRQQRSVASESDQRAEMLSALQAHTAAPGAELEEAEELSAVLEEIRAALPEETHRQILDLALAGHGAGDIARVANRSERTVSRVLKSIRGLLEERLADRTP